VLREVVVHVEAGGAAMRIEHADLDHGFLLALVGNRESARLRSS
jgi:hypothetical protein